jgi:hypothetical protein
MTMRKLHMGVLAAICLAAAFVLASRVTAQAEYRTEATIAPSTQAHQYVVHVKVIEVQEDGEARVRNDIKVTANAGEEGTASLGDDQGGVSCTALVKEAEGSAEAVITVTVKEDGAEKLNESQTVTLKK